MSTILEDMPMMSGLPGGADLSTEHVASTAAAASQAAQIAAGAIERLGGWLALLASRAPQMPIQAQQMAIPEVALAAAREEEGGKPGKGMAENIKRAAMTVGQRVSELSDGRFGLEAQPSRAETRQEKKAEKRLKRQARKEAKAEQVASGVHWLPWGVGLSLGLMIGLVGVAYWQRRRLQEMWGQTSQRMQQTTETMRQRLEASRNPPLTTPADMSAGASNRPTLGSAAPATDQQVNGRMQSTLPS
jgi:hypothetical protein